MNIIIDKFGDSLKDLLHDTMSNADSKNYFVEGRLTYDDVFKMAGAIKEFFSGCYAEKRPVCLCSEDKGVIAAAVIASLAGGPDLVLPYSCSEQVLSETKTYTGFTAVITDNEAPVDNIERFNPLHERGGSGVIKMTRELDSEFLSLFTGGSTGKPKVWPKTVRNIFAEGFYHSKKYSFSENDLVLATVPPYHIYGFLFSVIIPLVSSATVINKFCTFPREIVKTIEEEAPSILASVPVHYRVLNGIEFGTHNLRYAFSSSGPLNPDDADYFSKATGTPLVEVYGSTETGGIATRCRADGERTLRVFDNIDWKIKNEQLCVRSEFISPALPLDEDNFFVTGDRAEKDGDASFKLLGRVDGIVKIGGKRIDMGDIEEKIKSVKDVRNCIVLAFEGREGKGAELAALIEGSIESGELKEKIKKILEPNAVPRRIRIVDKIPVTPTGKYDKKMIRGYFT